MSTYGFNNWAIAFLWNTFFELTYIFNSLRLLNFKNFVFFRKSKNADNPKYQKWMKLQLAYQLQLNNHLQTVSQLDKNEHNLLRNYFFKSLLHSNLQMIINWIYFFIRKKYNFTGKNLMKKLKIKKH